MWEGSNGDENKKRAFFLFWWFSVILTSAMHITSCFQHCLIWFRLGCRQLDDDYSLFLWYIWLGTGSQNCLPSSPQTIYEYVHKTLNSFATMPCVDNDSSLNEHNEEMFPRNCDVTSMQMPWDQCLPHANYKEWISQSFFFLLFSLFLFWVFWLVV